MVYYISLFSIFHGIFYYYYFFIIIIIISQIAFALLRLFFIIIIATITINIIRFIFFKFYFRKKRTTFDHIKLKYSINFSIIGIIVFTVNYYLNLLFILISNIITLTSLIDFIILCFFDEFQG